MLAEIVDASEHRYTGERMAFRWSVNLNGYFFDAFCDDPSLACQPGDKRYRDLFLACQPGSKAYREYTPLEDYTGLFLNFANTQPTMAGIPTFANKYGLLGIDLRDWDGVMASEGFSTWAQQINAIRECVERWNVVRQRKGGAHGKEDLCALVNQHLHRSFWSGVPGRARLDQESKGIVDLMSCPKLVDPACLPSMQLMSSPGGKIALEPRPTNLLHALWLQFASAIVENTQFRQCLRCGNYFAVSPERRRADSQYCKESCRVQAYKARKKEARQLHAAGASLKKIAKQLGTSVEIANGWISQPER